MQRRVDEAMQKELAQRRTKRQSLMQIQEWDRKRAHANSCASKKLDQDDDQRN